MNTEGIERVAQALIAARRAQTLCDAAPLVQALHEAADAYSVQAIVANAMGWQQQGVARHWKSGGPSREAALTHAALPPQGVWVSPADARQWPFNQRLIEAEVALRLGHDVTAAQAVQLSPESAAAWVDAMAVSIEVVDFRWQQRANAPALLKLADLQSHGALVLGEWRPFAPRDWAQQDCTVRIGNRPLEERRGTHALADPAWLLPLWLRHVTRDGATAPKGTVVTTGTWCGMLPASAGDLVTARFEGVGEASVQL
ncbi:MAG: fumarylacetoacetate hydrolase family protein [Ramlibacter sp.]